MLTVGGGLLADDVPAVSDEDLAGRDGGEDETEALDECQRVGLVATGGIGAFNAPLA
jgi:hypothetical protein